MRLRIRGHDAHTPQTRSDEGYVIETLGYMFAFGAIYSIGILAPTVLLPAELKP